MEILGLTVLVSSCLAGIFICCFAAEARSRRIRGGGRDPLMPLDDPQPRRPQAGDH